MLVTSATNCGMARRMLLRHSDRLCLSGYCFA
jgi:hypothetical protein